MRFKLEKELSDEHEFFKVNVSDDALREEAERIGYKLWLRSEADKKELSEDCPAYVTYGRQCNKDELHEYSSDSIFK